MSDMDLLSDMPCYPFTCAELNDLRGGNGAQGKSKVIFYYFYYMI